MRGRDGTVGTGCVKERWCRVLVTTLAAKGSPSIFRMQDHKIAQQEKQALLLWLMSQLCKQVSLKPPFIVLYLSYGL